MKATQPEVTGLGLVWIVTFAMTLTSTQGQLQGCYYVAVPGFTNLFRDTHSGLPRKCAPGTIFDPKRCTCIHGSAKKVACPYKPIKTDRYKYREQTTGVIMTCTPGMIYKAIVCKCVPDKRRVCTPRYSLDFNSNTLKNKVIRYNVGGGESVGIRSGHGKFRNDSAVIFWTFQNRPFEDNFQIQMEFRDDPNEKQNQVLMTNCDANDPSNWPSLLIYLDKTKENPARKNLVAIRMRTEDKQDGVQVEVPFISGETNILVVLKARDTLKARIIYQNRKDAFSSNKLVGRVITSSNYLRLGSCFNDYNGFVGDMDWFDYFPCWPRQ